MASSWVGGGRFCNVPAGFLHAEIGASIDGEEWHIVWSILGVLGGGVYVCVCVLCLLISAGPCEILGEILPLLFDVGVIIAGLYGMVRFSEFDSPK